jgi:hypothetical protein
MKKKPITQESPALRLYKAVLKLGKITCSNVPTKHGVITEVYLRTPYEVIALNIYCVKSHKWLANVARRHCGFKASPELVSAVLKELDDRAQRKFWREEKAREEKTRDIQNALARDLSK